MSNPASTLRVRIHLQGGEQIDTESDDFANLDQLRDGLVGTSRGGGWVHVGHLVVHKQNIVAVEELPNPDKPEGDQ